MNIINCLSVTVSFDVFCAHTISLFTFSYAPCKMSAFKGREYRKNDASIKVDYNTSDPVVRWDSYENFNLHHQDSMESKNCTHMLV